FALTVSIPADATALANMREVRRAPDGGMVRVEFEPSPPLPTYLVAFAVGAFDTRDSRAGKVPMRLAAVSGKAALGAAGLAAGRGELIELERYFGRPYPYTKLDLLAVPAFGASAMENAGLVTFREERLLLDERAALAARVSMNSLIAHELAHQWFGDLVTMAWWDDVWLNEAFARFMADLIVQRFDPAWRFDVDRVKEASGAMREDSLLSARKIRQPIASDDDIYSAFDPI